MLHTLTELIFARGDGATHREIEKKFRVQPELVDAVCQRKSVRSEQITQVYLQEGVMLQCVHYLTGYPVERRIRKRGQDTYTTYTQTRKIGSRSGANRLETEHRISKSAFERLRRQHRKPGFTEIHKTRYTFSFLYKLPRSESKIKCEAELDEFDWPCPNEVILEIELQSKIGISEHNLPDWMRQVIIGEVTHIPEYSNYLIASGNYTNT